MLTPKNLGHVMLREIKIIDCVKITFAAALAALFICSPLMSLMVYGVFGWHIRQPAAWQGGLELAALFLFICAAAKFLSGKARRLVVTVTLWAYLRNQNVDLSAILLYLYFEAIISFGAVFLSLIGYQGKDKSESLIVSGAVGVIAWALCIWISSLLGFGSAAEIRWLTVCILGAALLLSKQAQLASNLISRIDSSDGDILSIIFKSFVVTIGAMLLAKTAVSYDYDSAWYGLFGDKVLVGGGNIFSSEGLVALVHYYPKMYESLLIPISGIGGISIIFSFGIFSWLLLLLTVDLLLRNVGVGNLLRAPTIALVASLPALANISMTAKGDTFAAWFLCVSLYSLFQYIDKKGVFWFWFCISAAIVSPLARLSIMPYSGILLIILFVVFAVNIVKMGRLADVYDFISSRSILIVAASLVLAALVTLRTLILAGVPVIAPDILVKLAGRFGMSLKFPAGRLAFSLGEHLPVGATLFSYLFNPAHFQHLEIYWTGNSWLYVLIVALLFGAGPRNLSKKSWALAILGGSFFVILFGFRFSPTDGADGNYFIFPLTCLTIFGGVALNEISHHVRLLKFVIVPILFVFVVTSTWISLVTGSWGPGTRGFNSAMRQNPLDFASRDYGWLSGAHLGGVASYFRGMPVATRVIGEAPVPGGWWLPVRYESIDVIAWSRPEFVLSPDTMIGFLSDDSIDYVVLRNNAAPADFKTIDSPSLRESIHVLQRKGQAHLVYSNKYYDVWSISFGNESMTYLKDGSFLSIIPQGNYTCDSSAPFVVKVKWNMKNEHTDSLNIYVKSPRGERDSLWSQVGPVGSELTGQWVSPGSTFKLRDAKDGRLITKSVVMPKCVDRNNWM